MPSPYDPIEIDRMKTTPDGRYHFEPMPGEIGDADAKLDYFGQLGWDVVDIYGRNVLMQSRVISQAGSHDAFGRSRVSQPYSIGDYKVVNGVRPATTLTASNGQAGVTVNGNRSSVTLYAHGPSGSYAVEQSRKYHNYLPGKSQTIYKSFVFGSPTSGSIKRVGYFDDSNGIFLEQDATGSLHWVVRSDATGTIQETRIPQTHWNVKTLLADPFILDVTKTQLLFIDFQWLGVGRIRCGFAHEGGFILTHVFDHTNLVDKVYIRTPNLPVRSEVRNVANASGSMEQICSTVLSEGGSSEAGRTWAVSTGRPLKSLASGSTIGTLAIRMKNEVNGYPNRAYVRLINASSFAADRSILFTVYKLPNQSFITTGSAWVSVSDQSAVEYNINITGYTDGRELLNGFVAAAGTGMVVSPGQDVEASNAVQDNYIAQNYDSTDSEIYIVSITNLTSNTTTVGSSLQWVEVS
jgi:hypothetical protein